MLGGGTFSSQNKKLPGTYINFISASRANAATSDRGVAAMALNLDWGPDGEIFKVTSEDFISNTLKLFGYAYSDDKMKGLRDLFLNAKTLYAYKLNSGEKAKVTLSAGEGQTGVLVTAKYSGIRGNDITIIIAKNVDDTTKYDVTTVMGTKTVDEQTVATSAELVDNDYVTFAKTGSLAVTAGTKLTGGTNGTAIGEAHQTFLGKLESYNFNAVGCDSADASTSSLYATFVKRMRENVGTKCQAVVYNNASDYEGVVNVVNTTAESTTGLIYWVTGIIASCEINQSNTNKVYNGEYTVNADYTQAQLEDAIDAGKFILHKVSDEIRVLKDINSLVSTNTEKSDDFKSNQTIRVIDQIATDVAAVFNNKYIGKIQNNQAGRTSLWADIVKLYERYQSVQAIENFVPEDISVEQGNDKQSVVVNSSVEPINAMEKLYMSVVIE